MEHHVKNLGLLGGKRVRTPHRRGMHNFPIRRSTTSRNGLVGNNLLFVPEIIQIQAGKK